MTQLRDQMLNLLRDEQDPRTLGHGAIFDTYKYLGARGKGYETWLQAQSFTPSAPAKAGKKNKAK
jgi:hypothetical protein